MGRRERRGIGRRERRWIGEVQQGGEATERKILFAKENKMRAASGVGTVGLPMMSVRVC